MRLLKSRERIELRITKGMGKKILFYAVPIIIIVLIGAGFYFGSSLLKELEVASRDYSRDAISAITKEWSPKELLGRGSKDFHAKTNIQGIWREFSVYREKLGFFKTLLDVQGKAKIKVGMDGIRISAEQRAQALYEKGNAVIDLALSYRNEKWEIDRFSVTSFRVSMAKGGEDSKAKTAEKKAIPLMKEEKPSTKETSIAAKRKDEKDLEAEKFSYTSRGRRDPFFAVVLNQRKRAAKEKSERGGYELEELRIVGILKTDKERFAMMEDRQGNGVVFKKGDYINKNLWIADITDDKIVYGYRLKNEVRTIVMDLPGKR